MNKRIFLRGLCAVFALAAFAGVQAEDKLTVVTTFTVIADMAKNVAGEHADVVSITKPGAEIHDYEPTPQDIVRAQKGKLLMRNGLNLERWFERFFENLHDVKEVVVSEGVEPIAIAGGAYNGKPNPHAWMSVHNAYIYVDNIAKALAAEDPAHADDYAKNAEAYKEKIKAMDKHIADELAIIPDGQRWLVTSEGAFSYLARDYNLKEASIWPVNAEEEGTPKQISALVELMRENHIPVIFSESTISDKPAKSVAQETGAQYGGVLYVDSLSTPEGKVPTYIDLLKVTTDTIISGFQKALKK